MGAPWGGGSEVSALAVVSAGTERVRAGVKYTTPSCVG